MKKTLLPLAAIALVSSVLISCKSHERCAAYSKINKIETGKHQHKSDRNS